MKKSLLLLLSLLFLAGCVTTGSGRPIILKSEMNGPFKGVIPVKVFLDRNGNGTYEETIDVPINGVTVFILGDTGGCYKTVTNSGGYASFKQLRPGYFEVRLDERVFGTLKLAQINKSAIVFSKECTAPTVTFAIPNIAPFNGSE